jgi:hypothetical protein
VISSPGAIARIARSITLPLASTLSALGRQEWLA